MFNKLVWIVLLVAMFLVGCGGSTSNSSTTTGSITVTPGAPTLAPGEQVTFSAAVTGLSATTVTWTAQRGTISTAGLYTAPSTSGADVVTATSTANSSVTGTATVTVSTTSSGIVVAVHPVNPTVSAGSTQQFSATVTGTSNTAVTWQAQGGTIDSTGLFTAPAITGNYVITAKSVANPSKAGTTIVRVVGTSTRISINPTSVTLPTGGTQTFTDTVNGSSNTAVIWTASGGTIDQAGNYTAPQNAGTYSVKVTSASDSSQSASATVTVSAVVIQISPLGASLLEGATQQFTATVSGTPNTAVTWTTTGGTITSGGLYTAPNTAGTYTVTATSVADPQKKSSVQVNVFNPVFYQNNFSGSVGTEWSNGTTSKTPSGLHFLGEFGSTSSDTLSLSGMPNHSTVTVTFQLYVIQAWKGDTTPDLWSLSADTNTLVSTTFSNTAVPTGTTTNEQSYPDSYLAVKHNPGTGATSTGTLGYGSFTGAAFADSVYSLSYTFNHSSSTLALDFAGTIAGTTATEGWGLANVKVTLNP